MLTRVDVRAISEHVLFDARRYRFEWRSGVPSKRDCQPLRCTLLASRALEQGDLVELVAQS